jgi:hypothetical protein
MPVIDQRELAVDHLVDQLALGQQSVEIELPTPAANTVPDHGRPAVAR